MSIRQPDDASWTSPVEPALLEELGRTVATCRRCQSKALATKTRPRGQGWGRALMWLAVGNATTVFLYQPLLTAALRRRYFIGVSCLVTPCKDSPPVRNSLIFPIDRPKLTTGKGRDSAEANDASRVLLVHRSGVLDPCQPWRFGIPGGRCQRPTYPASGTQQKRMTRGSLSVRAC